MRDFLQTVIPAVLTALIASRVAITRTGRLRSTIQANVELLDKLPANHPSREDLNEHVEELVDTLIRREYQQFEPVTEIAAVIYFYAIQIAMGLAGITLMLIDPLTSTVRITGLGVFVGLLLGSVGSLVAGLMRWRRERDLEEDDQDPDLEDDQVTVSA
jgi:hypothetical protein